MENSQEWQQQTDETAKAFQAAEAYFQMGPNRSLVAVAKKLGKNVSLMERWSKRWAWTRRARLFDEHLSRQKQNAMDEVAQAQALAWQERDEARRQQKWDTSQQMLSKAEKMLEFPLATVTTKTVAKDGVTYHLTTVRPVRWSMDTVHRLGVAGFRLSKSAIRNE
jgi:hypothetical protein